jgi:hypothetical protein
MSDTYLYSNQFKKKPVIGDSCLGVNPNPFQMDVCYDPSETSTVTLVAGEGVALKDLGADDMAAVGIPIVGKRTNNYDAVYGIRKFSVLKGAAVPSDNVVICMKGDVIMMKASGAISRGEKVALIVSTPGSVRTVTTGYAEVGVALDKGANGDLIRVELTTANEAVAAT